MRISTAESLDAVRAAATVGVEKREDFKAAIRASVAKTAVEAERFDRAFDEFFDRSPHDQLTHESSHLPPIDAELAQRVAAAAQSAGAGQGLSTALSDDAALSQQLESAMNEAGLSTMQSPMQTGQVALRTLAHVGLEGLRSALPELRQEFDEANAEAWFDRLAQRVEAIARMTRDQIRQRFAQANPRLLERTRSTRLTEESFNALSTDEAEQVAQEVQRLGRLFRERMDRRRHKARTGRFDGRATVRTSLTTQGVPVFVRWTRRPRLQPQLVAVCDVSDSVKAAARFFLHFVHVLQNAFKRTRTFAFVRDVGETTDIFRESGATEGVARVCAGEAISTSANSDYGRVLGQLLESYPDSFNRHTTLVFLGDARSNRSDPNLSALAELAGQVRRVLWFNPEPRASWGTGDSVMPQYAPFCSFTAPVANLKDLTKAVEHLASAVHR